MTDEFGHRPRKPIYLADLFVHFKVHAERVFSTEGTLRRLEEAKSLTSRKSPWTPDKNRVKRLRIAERMRLPTGLAFYLFDRFLHADSDQLGCILVETGAGQFQSVGANVFTQIGDLYLGRIDHWRQVQHARQHLIDIAGQYSSAYPLLDTTNWTVKDPASHRNGLDVHDEDEFQRIAAVREQMAPYFGLPLWFCGKKPTKKAINDLLGNTTWLEGDYTAELAQHLYEYYCLFGDPKVYQGKDGKLLHLEGGKLFQQDAANYLGIEKNTRTFMKIWRAFREKLTPEQQAKLPKRGEKKGGNKQSKGPHSQRWHNYR